MADGTGRTRAQIWLYPLAVLGTGACAVFLASYALDWLEYTPTAPAMKYGLIAQLLHFDPDTAQNALGNLAQVISAILGIVITVVSIVLQLAATRYTPRVADMFFRDRTNLAVLGFFVIATIDAVWVSISVAHDFVPRVAITGALLIVTASVLLMVPYFAYVFDFLDPERIIRRIEEQAVASTAGKRGQVARRQTRVLESIEQLGDIAMNSVAQKDKLIAQGAVDALRTLAARYLPKKRGAEAAWFEVGARLKANPDFVSMSPWSVENIVSDKTWLEWKVLRQYQAVLNEALDGLPDMGHVVAIDTRYIGEAALVHGDMPVLRLTIKFFNTYLRATLNRDQVRAAYNTLNQYRQLGERVLERGEHALVVEIAGYFRYYSQVAHGKGLSFVSETVAYDVATLCEAAHANMAKCHDALLKVLLDIDREAETVEHERALRGVRKAQAKLATYYLAAGDEAHARMIFDDMKNEPASRLASIRDELAAVQSKEFWEVIDRGQNFDYMDEARKARLREFFSWFPTLKPAIAAQG